MSSSGSKYSVIVVNPSPYRTSSAASSANSYYTSASSRSSMSASGSNAPYYQSSASSSSSVQASDFRSPTSDTHTGYSTRRKSSRGDVTTNNHLSSGYDRDDPHPSYSQSGDKRHTSARKPKY